MRTEKYGVVVGRFQTPYLTKGHHLLIDKVHKNHSGLIIFIGCTSVNPTKRNPLNYEARKKMIEVSYPNAIILPICDHVSDSKWSEKLDYELDNIALGSAVLYGGRDSFTSYYSGRYKVENIEPLGNFTATEIRNKTAEFCKNSTDFRAGIIYGVHNRYTNIYLCVDIAPIKENKYVLLAKKQGESNYRFIGGFVDTHDEDITHTAVRELEEEAKIKGDKFTIIGEAKIADWRYKNDDENIFTIFFKCDYISGDIIASDDIIYLEWILISELPNILFVTEHLKLKEILISNLNK